MAFAFQSLIPKTQPTKINPFPGLINEHVINKCGGVDGLTLALHGAEWYHVPASSPQKKNTAFGTHSIGC
jgi:hypothetical protein